ALRGVNLDIRAGEILGLAGVSGNGQRELAQVLFGLRPATSGRVLLEGNAVTGKQPSELNRIGMSYIPEERMIDGVITDFTVAENLILQTLVMGAELARNPRVLLAAQPSRGVDIGAT